MSVYPLRDQIANIFKKSSPNAAKISCTRQATTPSRRKCVKYNQRLRKVTHELVSTVEPSIARKTDIQFSCTPGATKRHRSGTKIVRYPLSNQATTGDTQTQDWDCQNRRGRIKMFRFSGEQREQHAGEPAVEGGRHELRDEDAWEAASSFSSSSSSSRLGKEHLKPGVLCSRTAPKRHSEQRLPLLPLLPFVRSSNTHWRRKETSGSSCTSPTPRCTNGCGTRAT